MEYLIKNKNIILKQEDFNLGETLDCGQAFRWEKQGNGFFGIALDKELFIESEKDYFILHNISEEDFLNFWVEYLDLHTDYKRLKELFSEDETLNHAVKFAPGIRLIKQDKWEALCSFIISQNNNIPRIKGIINRLCESYGDKTENGYGFPTYETLSKLSPEDLSDIRSGFRAKYIIDAARKLNSGELNLNDIAQMNIEDSRKALMTIKGVGPKVAECALLYGMYRIEAFPIDVWIKRVVEQYYPNGLPDCVKGYEGIAQQYLFHYIRNVEKN